MLKLKFKNNFNNNLKMTSDIKLWAFTYQPILKLIMSFLPGRRYADWKNGDIASKMGHLELMKQKQKDGCKLYYSTDAMHYAIQNGDIAIIKYLEECEPSTIFPDRFNYAYTYRSLPSIKYFYPDDHKDDYYYNDSRDSKMMIEISKEKLHPEITKFFYEKRKQRIKNHNTRLSESLILTKNVEILLSKVKMGDEKIDIVFDYVDKNKENISREILEKCKQLLFERYPFLCK
jgi:hypothetical protein